jgi:hypothetical protein
MAGERSLTAVRRPLFALLALVLASSLVAACGGGGGGDDAASDEATTSTTTAPLPAECQQVPATLDLRADGDQPAGDANFEATEAVALRTPILPGELAFDGPSLSAAQSQAEITPLAAYSLYLSDFAIDPEELRGRSLGMVTPPTGKTVGVLSLVPATEDGLAVGDVVTSDELGYETNSSLRQLSLMVLTDGNTVGMPYTDVIGQAEVLALDEQQICVAFDVTFENQGELVYAGKGTVAAPVVKSDPAFFFT